MLIRPSSVCAPSPAPLHLHRLLARAASIVACSGALFHLDSCIALLLLACSRSPDAAGLDCARLCCLDWILCAVADRLDCVVAPLSAASLLSSSSSASACCYPLLQSAKKVADDIAKGTMAYKGLRVTVKLIVQNRIAQIEVVPSAAALLVKALAEPERDRKKEKNVKHNGNVSLEQLYDISRTMRVRSMAKTFTGTVKEILGTAVSIGCTVNGKSPKDVQKEIDDGREEVPAQ